MYNRYLERYGSLRAEQQPGRAREREPQAAQQVRPAAPPKPARQDWDAPVQKHAPKNEAKRSLSTAGLKSALNGLLGDRLDIGDLLLILILLLLYLEKEDEEILIILSALVFMDFK